MDQDLTPETFVAQLQEHFKDTSESGLEAAFDFLEQHSNLSYVEKLNPICKQVEEYFLAPIKPSYYHLHLRTIELFQTLKDCKFDLSESDLRRLRFGDYFRAIIGPTQRRIKKLQHELISVFLSFVDVSTSIPPLKEHQLLSNSDVDNSFLDAVKDYVKDLSPMEQVKYPMYATGETLEQTTSHMLVTVIRNYRDAYEKSINTKLNEEKEFISSSELDKETIGRAGAFLSYVEAHHFKLMEMPEDEFISTFSIICTMTHPIFKFEFNEKIYRMVSNFSLQEVPFNRLKSCDLTKLRFELNEAPSDEIIKIYLDLFYKLKDPSLLHDEDLILGHSETEEKDLPFFAAVKKYVQSLSVPQQRIYLDFASIDVRENMMVPAEIIAARTPWNLCKDKKLTIILCGPTGVGKSCLANEILRLPASKRTREDDGGSSITTTLIPLTRAFSINGEQVEIEVIDMPGLERDKTQDQWNLLQQRIMDGFKGIQHPVNVILFCISCIPPRLDSKEQQWIRTLGQFLPVILVFTRSILSVEGFCRWMDDRTKVPVPLPLSDRIRILARDDKMILESSTHDSKTKEGEPVYRFGLPQLARSIARLYPESLAKIKSHTDLISLKTEESFHVKRNRSYALIAASAITATGIGASPIPFTDLLLLAPLQMTMAAGINSFYGVPLSKATIGTIVTTLIGSGSSSLAGPWIIRLGLECGKSIPFLNIPATAVSASMAGALTAAIGITFVNALERVCKAYPDVMNVDPDVVQKEIFFEAEKQSTRSSADLLNEISSAGNENIMEALKKAEAGGPDAAQVLAGVSEGDGVTVITTKKEKKEKKDKKNKDKKKEEDKLGDSLEGWELI